MRRAQVSWQLALMVLALVGLGLMIWLLWNNSVQANKTIGGLTNCAEGVVASALGESRCFDSSECGSEGAWLSLGKVGCPENQYCCVLTDETKEANNPKEELSEPVRVCSPDSYVGCEGKEVNKPFEYTNSFGKKCVICNIEGNNDYCGEPQPSSGC